MKPKLKYSDSKLKKQLEEARKDVEPFRPDNIKILKEGLKQQQKNYQSTPNLEDFAEKQISMIICKNENANLIAMENEDPEGLKPYQ